jgi:UDP-glucose 4-epimerase
VKPELNSEIKNSTILITGGLGFIGQNLAKTLITDFNCKVRIVDDCSNSAQQVHLNLPGESELYTYSILDFDKFFPLLNEVEYIFHLACVQMSRSSEIPFHDMNVNAGGTLGILEYLRNNRSGNFKKFIYSSSSSVYGNSKELPMNENTPVSILSQYAGSKLLGENYTILYNKKYGIPTTVLRLSNVYGLRQFASVSVCGVIGKFIENAICGKSVSIYGNGEQTRDYTFIDDVIDAAIIASVHPDSDGDIFNVSTNKETSVNEIISIMKGYFPELTMQHLPERDIDCVKHRRIDYKKIRDKLGWKPRIHLEEGVYRTISCFKNHLYKTASL